MVECKYNAVHLSEHQKNKYMQHTISGKLDAQLSIIIHIEKGWVGCIYIEMGNVSPQCHCSPQLPNSFAASHRKESGRWACPQNSVWGGGRGGCCCLTDCLFCSLHFLFTLVLM